MNPDAVRIDVWKPNPATVERDLVELAELLRACVVAGASVSFVLPFSLYDAIVFWRDQVLPAVSAGSRSVLLARIGEEIAGTVQFDTATPPNQIHRADVKKLLVHPEARRCGIARSLMIAIEAQARRARRTLLTPDTVTGGAAERLYQSLGYVPAGVIPGFAVNFDSSVLEATTLMYKQL